MRSNQLALIKDLVSSLKHGKPFNLLGVLELLNTSTEVDVQVKLFSILSAYIMLNNEHVEAIITYNPIYDKICKILINCPPGKTTVAFNFLTALLYVDDAESHRRNSLVAYARNMIRSSGCLASMCDLFTCMMNQDAWLALCRCLAESCHGVQANQSYCTHLVPMCVQRCNQRNIEVLVVLQSLLKNHIHNINLFIECNGISLFRRELLQHEVCLQLLATIAQCSTEAVALIAKTEICQQLRDFLLMYGPQSQLGQWATIVLFHTTPVKAPTENPEFDEDKNKNNRLSESLLTKLHPVRQQAKDYSADTTAFFQNVMKEITNCGAKNEYNNLKAMSPTNTMMNTHQKNSVKYESGRPFHGISLKNQFWKSQSPNRFFFEKYKQNFIQNDSLLLNKTNELSLSFLQKTNFKNEHILTNFVKPDKLESFQKTYQTYSNKLQNYSVYESFKENNESRLVNTLATNEFKPLIASTPKREDISNHNMYINRRPTDISNRYAQQYLRKNQMKRRLEKKKATKYLERSKIDKEIKHKSFSGRFFDAINTSCSTLVKTVKNIFKPKSLTKENSLNNTPNQETLSCSYSFTNYMRKRDALLRNDATYKSSNLVEVKPKENVVEWSMEISNSCNTCNNTIELRRKLAHDDHLKQTIRKLKLGINLYGCDFKKISRIMWPKENYMTPAVLYTLYRKLIIK